MLQRIKQIFSAPVVIKEAEEPRGFFSTDHALNDRRAANQKRMLAHGRTFQRDAKADIIAEDKVGMDEASSGLQLAKYRNSNAEYLSPGIFGWYATQGFIGYQTCAILSQQWLINKACSMPGRDAIRNWYEITANDGEKIKPEILDYIRKRDKKFRLKSECMEFVRTGRIFGIRIAIFNVDSEDPDYYEKPFNPDGVTKGSYRGITQVDPYWITPFLDQDAAVHPAKQHFYEPTWWLIQGKKYHRTHLAVFRNGVLPDILKPTYFYGGLPVPQLIAERVFAAEATANEAPQLAKSKRLTVLKTDITQAIANKDAFDERMQYWSQLMDNYGIKIIGDTDEVDQHETSLAELDATIMTQYQLVSAASGVPATKLLGTTPKGFNATGEYDERSYHEELESIQEHDLTPLVERHYLCLFKSEVEPKFGVKFEITPVWKPTDAPSALDKADINLKKAQTDQVYASAGALDGLDIRTRIAADPDSGYNGIEEIVPDGPGDRDAQQENEGQPLESAVQASNKQKTAKDGKKKK